MSTGLIALLDDVAGIVRVAAASLDDAATQATRAGVKAAGVVVDDAAVTPRYVTGFTADRELPIIGKIALGSVKNKLVYLLPLALLLSLLAPWAVTPLLMLGGDFLCYEGAEKVWHALRPHQAEAHEVAVATAAAPARELEEQKVRSAIKTDFILSAEIMALTLSDLAGSTVLLQAVVLAVVGLGLTALVYGGVALIVKADDLGLALAHNPRPVSTLLGLRSAPADGQAGGMDQRLRPVTQGLGRGLVRGMPHFLWLLAIIGTAAMLWVGGGIVLHGLEAFGLAAPGHAVHAAAAAAGEALPSVAGAAEWFVTAAISGVFGLLIGALLIPLVRWALVPALARLRGGVAPEE